MEHFRGRTFDRASLFHQSIHQDLRQSSALTVLNWDTRIKWKWSAMMVCWPVLLGQWPAFTPNRLFLKFTFGLVCLKLSPIDPCLVSWRRLRTDRCGSTSNKPNQTLKSRFITFIISWDLVSWDLVQHLVHIVDTNRLDGVVELPPSWTGDFCEDFLLTSKSTRFFWNPREASLPGFLSPLRWVIKLNSLETNVAERRLKIKCS